MAIVAIDIGGTFTDLAYLDPSTGLLKFSKSLTTPPNFEQGAMDCIRKADIETSDIEILRHGTTVVINALLEHKGSRTALVTTEGFRDMLEIGRGNRPEGFNLFYERLPPVVPRDRRFGAVERIDSRGDILTPLDINSLKLIADNINNLDGSMLSAGESKRMMSSMLTTHDIMHGTVAPVSKWGNLVAETSTTAD